MPTALPPSIPDTQLGLSNAEIQLLRRHQEVALSASAPNHPSSHYGGSSAMTRGRGTARVSNASSRAASASSHAGGGGGGGRLMLDPGSLAVLGSHFDRLMSAISTKVDSLNAQTTRSIQSSTSKSASSIAAADKEIARMRDILRMIDELETEYDKVRHIRDIVKSFRGRVEGLERRVDAKSSHHSASHSSRGGKAVAGRR